MFIPLYVFHRLSRLVSFYYKMMSIKIHEFTGNWKLRIMYVPLYTAVII